NSKIGFGDLILLLRYFFKLKVSTHPNTRLKMFAEISNKQQWVAAPHLPFPGIGHVYKVNAEQYQWIPLYFNNSLDK
ncbi:hypothetical protein ABTB00_15515, partial [Acinetobacter baumannii]|nr:hypothetical protein [Acinetobacter baumannii]